MFYVVDTTAWDPTLVVTACTKRQIPVRPGFEHIGTQKLASSLLKDRIVADFGASGISVDSKGRPHLVGAAADFSLTHHNEYVVAVAAVVKDSQQKLGIDLCDASVDYFQPEELEELFGKLPASGEETAVWWAAREAYMKYYPISPDEPIKVARPAHMSIPALTSDLRRISMPVIRVETKFARLFRVSKYIGAVIAPPEALDKTVFLSPGSGIDF